MSKAKLNSADQTRVVAMIARGDTYDSIKRVLSTEGIDIGISAISEVKRRNMDALRYMQDALIQHEAHQSTKILSKSRRLIERKLDRALSQDEEFADIKERYASGEIDEFQLKRLMELAMRQELSVGELTSLTKEAFNQSQVEQGKPTSITENPAQAKENLKTLLEAINSGDEALMAKAIFLDA